MPTTQQEEKIDVLIVTASKGEDSAVKKVFGSGWQRMVPTPQLDLYWDKITLNSKRERQFTVGLVRKDMRAEDAESIVTILLSQLEPSFLAMCGICAGRPGDTNLCDVIISDTIFHYDQKSVERWFYFFVKENWEPSTYPIAKPLRELAGRIKIGGIKIHVGSIATGGVLQHDSSVWKTIQRECIGLDMEASVIAHINHIIDKRWIVIKGVSCNATSQRDDRFRLLAQRNAATVLKEFLEDVADNLPKIDETDGVWFSQNDIE